MDEDKQAGPRALVIMVLAGLMFWVGVVLIALRH